jgi:hypothetical protein
MTLSYGEPGEARTEPNRMGPTLIITGPENSRTPFGIRRERTNTVQMPSLMDLALQSEGLPEAGFGSSLCFQATDFPGERTQVCMAWRHPKDVTEEYSEPELFFFRLARNGEENRPHILFSAGKEGLTVYADDSTWWTGRKPFRVGRYPKAVARIGTDGVIKAKKFEVWEGEERKISPEHEN